MIKEIYLIMVDNNESYEDHWQTELGFVETEQEAKEVCERLTAEASKDMEEGHNLNEQCRECNKVAYPGCCNDCSIQKRIEEIEAKDIYSGCWAPGSGSYFYRKVERF